MGIMNKIKRIFRKENQIPGQKKEILPPSKWKYENMVLFAPSIQIFYTDNKKHFYISAYDENNNPITNENIHINIDGEESDIETNSNGNAKIFVDFEPGNHYLEITYPNGEYSQKIISKIRVKEKRTVKSGKTPENDENGKKEVSLSIPNMKMYVNNEGNYYARLREKKGHNPIEGEEIIFEINDEIFKSKTDEEGFARLPIKDIHKGKHKVKARYEGNSQYKSASKKNMLTMMRRDIDEEVVIDVEHLTMEFKVTKDKIDTLKELIIRTLKRNKETDETITILDDISFKVYKGDRLGILGFNGAGKSTLLKIMSGIYEPTSGSIKTYGKIAPLLELGAGFDKNYSGKNNIFLNGSLLSIDEKTLHEKYDEIVEFSELGDFINFPIKNYSSGMRTKLGFSIATQINPDILIIDEILSVGDIKFKKKSGDKINSMMKDGVTVLLVSHSIKQMKDICDRCIWLENGQIKMDGDADEVCEAYINGAEKDIKKNR